MTDDEIKKFVDNSKRLFESINKRTEELTSFSKSFIPPKPKDFKDLYRFDKSIIEQMTPIDERIVKILLDSKKDIDRQGKIDRWIQISILLIGIVAAIFSILSFLK